MITDLQFGEAFVRGKRYRRKQIHDLYKGQEQSEISTPKEYPYIFIFTKMSGEEYGTSHGWNDDQTTFFYTGEGQRGTMQLIKGNKAVMEHAANGETIYLFQYVESGIVEFLDEMTYVNHQLELMWDADGSFREAIMFELKPNHVLEEKANAISINSTVQEELLEKFYEEKNLTKKVAFLHRYIKARANGKCESCGAPASFKDKKGMPYLELHHINHLTDSGLNRVDQVAALCPICHSHIYHGQGGGNYNARLGRLIKEKELEAVQ
ncbi:HNH endonuclease signature motif containing protein [Priestia flexa]|uniref:HNH endonuclease signature motif containing protein n=1 Tax=Priestia flexa TaxID=86664 RepID=A0ABU4J5K5_9BACI|nr:HNH endonuclease signature motif containing protein [Priestia flexa]MDW8516255.1 HNH endonuclease signature motif containing protein [Priestia flexa]